MLRGRENKLLAGFLTICFLLACFGAWRSLQENDVAVQGSRRYHNRAAYQDQRTPFSIAVHSKQRAAKNRQAATDQANEEDTNRQLAKFTRELVGVGIAQAIVLALSVIALAVQAVFLLITTRDNARQYRSTNKAFVFLRYFFYMPTTGNNNKVVEFWRITPVFENSGNTATRHMLSSHSASLRDTPLPDDFDFPDTPFPVGANRFLSRDLIAPHAQLNGAPYMLSISDIIAVSEGRKRFYMWGWSDYDDVFGVRHRFEYCYSLAVLYDPRNPANNQALGMGLHTQHNGIDDECMRAPSPYVPPR